MGHLPRMDSRKPRTVASPAEPYGEREGVGEEDEGSELPVPWRATRRRRGVGKLVPSGAEQHGASISRSQPGATGSRSSGKGRCVKASKTSDKALPNRRGGGKCASCPRDWFVHLGQYPTSQLRTS